MEEIVFKDVRDEVEKQKYALRIAGTGEHPHEPIASKAESRMTWKEVCDIRWANCEWDKMNFDIYRGRQSSYREFYEEVEHKHRLFFESKIQFTCRYPYKEGRPHNRQDTRSRTKLQEANSTYPVFPVAINELFAVLLSQKQYQTVPLDHPRFGDRDFIVSAGELQVMYLPDYRIHNFWCNTGVVIQNIQAAYLYSARLHILDGSVMRVFSIERTAKAKPPIKLLEIANVNLFERDGLNLESTEEHEIVRSLSASAEFILITSESGFAVLKSAPGLPLLYKMASREKPLPPFTVGAIDGRRILLGTKSPFVETWIVDENDQLAMSSNDEVLKTRKSSLSGRTLTLSDPTMAWVNFLYTCPGRVAVGSFNNLISRQNHPVDVMAQVVTEPVISMATYGDLCVLLHCDGRATIQQFASGQAIREVVLTLTSFNQHSMSATRILQWTSMSYDTIFILTLNGDLYALMAAEKLS